MIIIWKAPHKNVLFEKRAVCITSASSKNKQHVISNFQFSRSTPICAHLEKFQVFLIHVHTSFILLVHIQHIFGSTCDIYFLFIMIIHCGHLYTFLAVQNLGGSKRNRWNNFHALHT